MDFINANILTLVTFSPLACAVIILIAGQLRASDRAIKWLAFLLSLIPAALAIYLWVIYPSASAEANGFKFYVEAPWFPQINSRYILGIDGISLSMILLTAILTPLAILISFSINERVRAYMALFMLLETGMLGVFVSLDMILFFIFWEIGLVPMYFLINQWGSGNRNYASFKFFILTMAGSVGMLLAFQVIWMALGGPNGGTYSIVEIAQRWPTFDGTLFGLPASTVRGIAFWAFTIAFAIKAPIWPFHTWLPDAHTEAPTAGSMILAGVLLKLGAFGFLRIVLPFFPVEAAAFAPVLAILALLGIVLAAFSAFGQDDFKRLVALSSVNHMGFVVLGIAVAAYALGSSDPAVKQSAVIATNGAVLQMWAHGLSAAAMFALVGMVYDRAHTRDLNRLGGLWAVMPIYGGVLIFSAMANLGLPGLAGFPAEFAVVRGAWPVFSLITALSMIGLLFTGAYILKAIGKVLHGPESEAAHHVSEMNWIERIALAPLLLLMLVTGLFPAWVLNVINQAVTRLIG
ncbi:MAG TPA: NADH-quinone oxidoreductase subunit M [Anaerolineae bacterium]|nr:NADH-quinone oxidoreductase subunit M [Anaerolineae bacterium]